jgi:hypothetical protein
MASAAAAETYSSVYGCEFVIRGDGGQKTGVIIAIDAQGKAYTFDRGDTGDEVKRFPVSVRRLGSDSYIFTYTFNSPNADRGLIRIDAQMRVPKAGGASRISITGRGFYGNPTGQGTCKLQRNVKLPR